MNALVIGGTRNLGPLIVEALRQAEELRQKLEEERKARVLEANGYDMTLDSPDWASKP